MNLKQNVAISNIILRFSSFFSFPLHLGVVAIEKGAFVSPSTMVANFTYLLIIQAIQHDILTSSGYYFDKIKD